MERSLVGPEARHPSVSVPLVEAAEDRWIVPRSYKPGMRVDGLVFASKAMVPGLRQDNAVEQVANVATLPGIVGRSLAMPDIHWGYGFPIGGVAAIDADDGVVSPGGVGYDINCGVRLLRSDLTADQVRPRIQELVDTLFSLVPSGVGGKGVLNVRGQIDEVLTEGARWAVDQGYGWAQDLERTEEGGRMKSADPGSVSPRARQRGALQLGSLGAGNHFLEVQAIDRVEDAGVARAFDTGRKEGVCIMIHTGSRGLGYQVCDDYVHVLDRRQAEWGLDLPDRQLASAPMRDDVAQKYLGAMAAAANFAWANREVLSHQVRVAFEKVFGRPSEELGLRLVYDVSHNMAKVEEHDVDGRRRKLVVHRKGATRAFGPERAEVPAAYRAHGQPVLVPGDMGTSSWILAGTENSMKESFGSCCHGAGRKLSRAASNRQFQHAEVMRQLRDKGIYLRALTIKGVTEEAPGAYKDVDEVVNVVHRVGIGRKVARLRPLGVLKG